MADYTYKQLIEGITTDEATINVELPLGEHHIELVVEDSAGLRSAPDSVVIRVVRPTITSIEPTSLPRGFSSQQLAITGTDLETATRVEFDGQGVTVESIEEKHTQELILLLGIGKSAELGHRGFKVFFPGEGISEVDISSGNEKLEITGAASGSKIDSIDPDWGEKKEGEEVVVPVTIQGSGLGEPVAVLFPQSELTASVESANDEEIQVNINIPGNATPGPHQFEVYRGEDLLAESGNITFKVGPWVEAISPNFVTDIPREIHVTITGRSLQDTEAIHFLMKAESLLGTEPVPAAGSTTVPPPGTTPPPDLLPGIVAKLVPPAGPLAVEADLHVSKSGVYHFRLRLKNQSLVDSGDVTFHAGFAPS